MPGTIAALEFLAHPENHPVPPLCAVFGEEPYLRRLVLAEVKEQVLGAGDADFSLTRLDGSSIELRDVLDELSTMALFGGGRRMVIVEDADDFVSRYRASLEDYAARPRTSAVLVLDVVTWPKTTRLYKTLESQGLQIDCKTPDARGLLKWLGTRASKRHGTKLEASAAELLLELVGPELGLLDQELAKLAVSAPPGKPITEQLVQEMVGGWRAKTAWDMIDSALAGNARDALEQLERLLLAGENPIGILAQISATLRRFAAAVRIVERGEASKSRVSLRDALQAAGVKPFVLAKSEQQLRHLGRVRAGQLYRWLLEADLELKGQSSSPPRARLVLERLIVRLAAPAPRSVVG